MFLRHSLSSITWRTLLWFLCQKILVFLLSFKLFHSLFSAHFPSTVYEVLCYSRLYTCLLHFSLHKYLSSLKHSIFYLPLIWYLRINIYVGSFQELHSKIFNSFFMTHGCPKPFSKLKCSKVNPLSFFHIS